MTEGETNIERHQGEEEYTQCFVGTEWTGIKPAPTPRIQSKTVEQFHRDDDPRYAKKLHGRPANPSLTEVKSNQRHAEQSNSTDGGGKYGTDQSTDGRPNDHHGYHQTAPELLFTVYCKTGHGIRNLGRRLFFFHGK